MQASHDAREPHRPLRVGDEKHVALRLNRLAIEEHHALTVPRQAHPDPALELSEIVGVHRLAELEHHVVGDIHYRAYGAHARAAQTLAHPERNRRAIVDAAQDAACEARTGRRSLELHREALRVSGGRAGDGRTRDRGAGERRHLARNAQDREHVAPIGRHVEVEHRLIEIEVFTQRAAERRIRRQLENSARGLGESELLRGSEHALRFHAPELRRLDGDITASTA